MQKMEIGDLYQPDQLAELMLKRVTSHALRAMGLSYEQFSAEADAATRSRVRTMFASGGLLKPREPQPLPEGAVGRTVTGQPIFDGDWFDKHVSRVGEPGTIIVTVQDGKVVK